MTARRPALIFDFGNVVAFFDHSRACESFGRRVGLTGPAFLDRLRERGFIPLLQSYERGAISSEMFSRSVAALAELEIPHDEFAAAWSDIFWLNEPVATLLRTLKAQGYTLVLGSNTNDLHASQFRAQFADTLAVLDAIVLSHEVGHIKPSSEFYLACAEAAGAAPADCVFIDDLAENVEGARAAGLQAVQFGDVPSLLSDLSGLGVQFGSQTNDEVTRVSL